MCELKVLHVVDFQRDICIIIPDAQRAQQHLYMGVRVGISAKYRTRSTPSSGKKKNKLFDWSRVQSVQGENTPLSPFTYFYFLYPDCDVQSRLELSIHWSSFAIRCQAQTDEGQMVRSLTSSCVMQIHALRRILALQLPR